MAAVVKQEDKEEAEEEGPPEEEEEALFARLHRQIPVWVAGRKIRGSLVV